MYVLEDFAGSQLTASLIYGPGNEPMISVEVTNLIGVTSPVWIEPGTARELAAAIIARCNEADTATAAELAVSARAETGLVGTVVRRIDDYGLAPNTGIITGTWLDTEGDLTCYVAWGCYSLDETSAAVPVPHDELTPAGADRGCRSCGFHHPPGVTDCPRWPAIESGQDVARHDEGRAFAAHLMAERGWRQP